MLSAKLSLLVLLALFVVIILVYLHQSVNHFGRGNELVHGSSARVALQQATHVDNKDTNTCAHDFGRKFFDDWRSRSVSVVEGVSNVTCARNKHGSSFCKYQNVRVDFFKMHTHYRSRSFDEGFLTAHGEMKNYAHAPRIPGFYNEIDTDANLGDDMTGSEGRKWTVQRMAAQCDIIETRPTFVLSNDDIFNLAHYFNDLMGVWGMLMLSGADPHTAVLLNMDGFRKSGPAGGIQHRLMVTDSPDEHGPFAAHYHALFAEMQKARDFGAQRVCYKELYLPPQPEVPWIWNDWRKVNECSLKGASQLYLSFNAFLRQQWAAMYGPLPNPPTDKVHIVLQVRSVDPTKHYLSAARNVVNIDALIQTLRSIPNTAVTVQDFALLSFAEQVALAHSAGVLVSMHGASVTHIFHAALGQPNCCAFVELFPDKTVPFHEIKGFGNLARMLGVHYYEHTVDLGATGAAGTVVNVDVVKALVTKAVTFVHT